MRSSIETPNILIVQARAPIMSIVNEQNIVRRIAKEAEADVTFVNPLFGTGRRWRDGSILDGADGVVWMGSSTLDHTQKTPEQLRFEELAFPVMKRALLSPDLPNMGICYGAQAMARVAGGAVERKEQQGETGTTKLLWTIDGKEYGLADLLPKEYALLLGHKDSVTRLPEGATVLAETSRDPHALWTYPGNNYAVQGHPEQTDAEGLRMAIALSQ